MKQKIIDAVPAVAILAVFVIVACGDRLWNLSLDRGLHYDSVQLSISSRSQRARRKEI